MGWNPQDPGKFFCGPFSFYYQLHFHDRGSSAHPVTTGRKNSPEEG